MTDTASARAGRRKSIAGERATEALQRGWRAHLLGHRTEALVQLEALRRGLAGLGEDQPAVMLGLSLYAFTCASMGEDDKAMAAANNVAAIARTHDPQRNTPSAIRTRIASALPTEPVALRLREGLQRWTLAVAYRLPSTRLRLGHERDLNRLRLALQAEAESATPEQAG